MEEGTARPVLDNYRSLIDELLGTPTELRRLVEAGAATPAAETVQLLAELKARDEIVLDQVQIITRQRDPYLKARTPGALPPGESTEAILAGFDSARGELVSTLMNLTLRDWERSAIHETEGEVRLVDLVEQHVDFDEDQVAQLRALLSGA